MLWTSGHTPQRSMPYQELVNVKQLSGAQASCLVFSELPACGEGEVYASAFDVCTRSIVTYYVYTHHGAHQFYSLH